MFFRQFPSQPSLKLSPSVNIIIFTIIIIIGIRFYCMHENVVFDVCKIEKFVTDISFSAAGFPNKLAYPEFKARYNIIGASAVAKAKNDKAAAGAIMDIVKLDKEKFRLGHTLVFFR